MIVGRAVADKASQSLGVTIENVGQTSPEDDEARADQYRSPKDNGAPMPADISACFVIRFALGEESDRFTGVIVRNMFLGDALDARISFLRLNSVAPVSSAVHPAALQMALFPGDVVPAWVDRVVDPSANEAQTLVRVDFSVPDWSIFWRVSTDGKPEKVESTHEALYTFVMDSAAIALERITTEDETPVATIFPPDLLGDGLIRFVDPSVNEPWHMRLPSRPPMGSFRSRHIGSIVSPELDPTATLTVPDYGSPSTRRLLAWQNLYRLRYQRGEWAEAIVAIEAQFEALMWRFLELLLVDHGWRRDQFEAAESSGAGWQVRSTLGALQHHLGGSAASWGEARESFKDCWRIRNDVVHRSLEASRSMADRAHEATQEYVSLALTRIRDRKVAEIHPITATLILGRDVSAELLGTDLAQLTGQIIDLGPFETRDLNDHFHRGTRVESLDRNSCSAPTDAPNRGFDLSSGQHRDHFGYRI